jgi:hypothetical protein
VDVPDIRLGPRPGLFGNDLTDQVVTSDPHAFRVNDRIERLTGRSEQAQWDTIRHSCSKRTVK